MLFAEKWMEFDIIMIRYRSQAMKDKNHMCPLTHRSFIYNECKRGTLGGTSGKGKRKEGDEDELHTCTDISQ
jgi:hypothetical protein